MDIKKILQKRDLNRRDNGYVDYIDGEKWKTISEYPDYIISNYGRVFSKLRNRLLTPFFHKHKDNKLYYRLTLADRNGIFKQIFLHRLVALAFVPNTEGKPYVHHIDCNILNNKAENLMWVTDDEHKEIHRKMKETEKRK